jgi:signal transduction histidine kinase
MLQFSRAEPRSLTAGDINAVIAEAARLARPMAEMQGVSVETDLSPSLPKVEIDASALLQVVRNLTTNALQAMPKGGTLRLASRFLPNDGLVEATVADTGTGLSRQVRDHLFEPFFTTKESGTGIGLAIAREIVLAHRGELRADNNRGGGAVFTLTFPESASVAVEGLAR